MKVPPKLQSLVIQRKRWALGLAQVLRRYRGVIASWRTRRMWPVYVESTLSIVWAYCFVVLTAFWLLSYPFGILPVGVWPIPHWRAMTIGTLLPIQLLNAVRLDYR